MWLQTNANGGLGIVPAPDDHRITQLGSKNDVGFTLASDLKLEVAAWRMSNRMRSRFYIYQVESELKNLPFSGY